MSSVNWITLILLSYSPMASAGGDTPFLKFNCSFGHQEPYRIEFKNNDEVEVQTWVSSLKRSRITFEKQNKIAAVVTIHTGVPLLSSLAPEEYKFTAPLAGDRFGFSFTQKPVDALAENLVSLSCFKVKE